MTGMSAAGACWADEAETASRSFRLAFLLGSAGTACTLSHDKEAAQVGGMAGYAALLLDATVVGACAEVKAASLARLTLPCFFYGLEES